jgi:hypothetical protein
MIFISHGNRSGSGLYSDEPQEAMMVHYVQCEIIQQPYTGSDYMKITYVIRGSYITIHMVPIDHTSGYHIRCNVDGWQNKAAAAAVRSS